MIKIFSNYKGSKKNEKLKIEGGKLTKKERTPPALS